MSLARLVVQTRKVGRPGHSNYVGLVVTIIQLSGHLVIDITRNLRQLEHDRFSETKRTPRRAIFIHEYPRKVDLHQVGLTARLGVR